MNPAGEMMSGYSCEELLRPDFSTFIHPEYQELIRERRQARARGEPVPKEYEFKFIKKNGDECWVIMTAESIEYKGKPAIIATLFDITEWKNAEEAKTKFFEESVRQYQERTEEVGGSVTIFAEKGTLVSLEIPFPLQYPIPLMEM